MSNWLQVLRDECKAQNQAKVAKILGCANSTISQVLKGTYPAKPIKLEQLVLKFLCGEVVEAKQYVPKKNVKPSFLLEVIDFIFCHYTVSSEDLKSKFERNRIGRALRKLIERDLLLVYEQPREMRGRPHKFYRLRCACPAPGLMPSCPQCPLGSLVLKLDKDIPKDVHDDDC
jgi:DNA-binding XRE family transcriptional regulator